MPGYSEDDLCRIFAERVKDDDAFAAWVLKHTKFCENAESAKLLYNEQIAARPNVSNNRWWRHWWCFVPELNAESETDIFLVFEQDFTKMRFALHIENKLNGHFQPGQAAGYDARARYMMGKDRYLSYSDYETALFAPQSLLKSRPQECSAFGFFIAHEQIAEHVSEYGGVFHDRKADIPICRVLQKADLASNLDSPSMWTDAIERIRRYFTYNKHLKYGPHQENKAFPFLDVLCEAGFSRQTDLMERLSISPEAIATILSNVTMALQGNGAVKPLEDGGWYLANKGTYTIASGFATAWRNHREKELAAMKARLARPRLS